MSTGPYVLRGDRYMTAQSTVEQGIVTREGRTLSERLQEQFRRVSETGLYEPDLSAKEKDPIAFEVLFNKLLQTVTNAREIALSISASPSTREQGEIIFG